jgi:ribonucleoside-diphosphate reductase alpha chain
VDFLDDVIDVNRYPLAEIAAATLATRKIGLGVMGFADLLIELGIPYVHPKAEVLGAEVAGFLARESLARSRELAVLRGSFPEFAGSRWADPATASGPLRNATTTTVAPTGTISMIAGCSSGIEPLFAVAYRRRVLDGEILTELHPRFRQVAEHRGFWSDTLAEKVATRGSVRGLDEVPVDVQELFGTAYDVPVEVHVRMQAAFQQHVHAAVSKTINLASTSTPADVSKAYQLAYQLGCKGVTVYRDGSRDAQVLSFGPPPITPTSGVAADTRPTCPECNRPLTGSGRCRACVQCGWSSCG